MSDKKEIKVYLPKPTLDYLKIECQRQKYPSLNDFIVARIDKNNELAEKNEVLADNYKSCSMNYEVTVAAKDKLLDKVERLQEDLKEAREKKGMFFKRANTLAEALKQSSAKELDLLTKVDALTLENRKLKGENEQTKRCIETLQGSNARLFAYTERLRSWKGRFLNLFGLCRLR